MSNHIVKVLKADFITHNVRRFVVQKPAGYAYVSGQATDVSIHTPELEQELRPFTFTSINQSPYLEFIIKIYKGHNGITEKLSKVNPGDELVLHDVFGAINYQGPGLFIAGGAGITPFISIFRQLQSENKAEGNALLFANKTEHDIILGPELRTILGNNYVDILSAPLAAGSRGRYIDKALLSEYVSKKISQFYICGPESFTNSLVQHLTDLGIDKSRITLEQ